MRGLVASILVAAALSFGAAAAASAYSTPTWVPSGPLSGVGVPSPVASLVAAGAQKKTTHTCQATHRGQTARRGKFIPIACEQPPRMNMLGGNTLTNALTVDSLS